MTIRSLIFIGSVVLFITAPTMAVFALLMAGAGHSPIVEFWIFVVKFCIWLTGFSLLGLFGVFVSWMSEKLSVGSKG